MDTNLNYRAQVLNNNPVENPYLQIPKTLTQLSPLSQAKRN